MVDLHTHSLYSADGKQPPEKYIERAIELGCKVFGFSEHLDYDYEYGDGELTWPMLDIDAYWQNMNRLKQLYGDKIELLSAIECGYHPLAAKRYKLVLEKYKFDYVINSTHTIGGMDPYFQKYFKGKDKQNAYSLYLQAILESIRTTEFDYQVIGHIGYITRYAPYPDRALRYSEYKNIIDEILTAAIKLGKTLEVNTNISAPSAHLPPADIITRYYELGGRLITFSSDAHSSERVLDKYHLVTRLLKAIGFTQLSYFKDRELFLYDI